MAKSKMPQGRVLTQEETQLYLGVDSWSDVEERFSGMSRDQIIEELEMEVLNLSPNDEIRLALAVYRILNTE